jgi:hypothetical protein
LAVLKKNHLDEQYVARRSVQDLPQTIAGLSARVSNLTADRISTPASALSLLDNVQQAVANCNDFAEVRELRDQAAAVRHYLKAAAMDLEVLNRAAIVKLLCERRAGSILGTLVKRGGDRRANVFQPNSRLDKLGIKNKMQSSRLQMVASVPEDEFWQYVNQLLRDEKEVTTQGLLRFAQERCCKSTPADVGIGDLAPVADGLINLAKRRKQYRCVYASPVWCGCRKVTAAELAKSLSELPVKSVVPAMPTPIWLCRPNSSRTASLSLRNGASAAGENWSEGRYRQSSATTGNGRIPPSFSVCAVGLPSAIRDYRALWTIMTSSAMAPRFIP